MEHVRYDHESHPNRHGNNKELCYKKDHPFELQVKSLENEKATWSDVSRGREVSVEQMLGSGTGNYSKQAKERASESESITVNSLSKVVRDRNHHQKYLVKNHEKYIFTLTIIYKQNVSAIFTLFLLTSAKIFKDFC